MTRYMAFAVKFFHDPISFQVSLHLERKNIQLKVMEHVLKPAKVDKDITSEDKYSSGHFGVVNTTASSEKINNSIAEVINRVAMDILPGKLATLSHQMKAHTSGNCMRKNNIAYIKTFKTGSSTIVNILNRLYSLLSLK